MQSNAAHDASVHVQPQRATAGEGWVVVPRARQDLWSLKAEAAENDYNLRMLRNRITLHVMLDSMPMPFKVCLTLMVLYCVYVVLRCFCEQYSSMLRGIRLLSRSNERVGREPFNPMDDHRGFKCMAYA